METFDKLFRKRPTSPEELDPTQRFDMGLCPACCAELRWINQLWSSGEKVTRYTCPKCGWTGIGPTKRGKPTHDSLGRPLKKQPTTIESLVQALGDESLIAQGDAVDRLVLIGDEAIDPLIQVLKENENASVREGAAEALGLIRDARAVESLIQALNNDENASVRDRAAEALGNIRDDRAVGPLLQALKDEANGVRSGAAFALGKIGDESVVGPLTEALKDEDEWVRELAKEALEKIKAKKS